MYLRFSVAIALVAILLAGCAHKKHARRTPPPPAPAPLATPKPGYTETGLASWYGRPYHGRRAANGEIYDMEKLTAAHRTLPFDTWLRVANLDNSKTVEVRITDRGPFVEGRIIDLSHAAARAIDMIGPGIARVRLEVIRTPDLWRVLAGSEATEEGANGLAQRIRKELGEKSAAFVVRVDSM